MYISSGLLLSSRQAVHFVPLSQSAGASAERQSTTDSEMAECGSERWRSGFRPENRTKWGGHSTVTSAVTNAGSGTAVSTGTAAMSRAVSSHGRRSEVKAFQGHVKVNLSSDGWIGPRSV